MLLISFTYRAALADVVQDGAELLRPCLFVYFINPKAYSPSFKQ